MAKKNGKLIISIVGLAIVIASCIMSIAKSYFILPVEVAHQAKGFADMKDDNDEEHKEFESEIDICKKWRGEVKSEMVGIKKDIGYLGSKIDDSMLEQRTMQKTILDKIEGLQK